MNVLRRFVTVVRDGLRIWWLAPAIPLLIVVPEFAQHVAEIRLGMFEGGEAARAAADHPTRWAFGYLKIAGLLLAILATIRFWSARAGRWWDVRDIAWKPTLLALSVVLLSAVPGLALRPTIGEAAAGWVDLAVMLATLPALALLVAGLSSDRQVRLRTLLTTGAGWLATLRILVFAAAVWVPLQWVHGLNHQWAIGAAEPVVWALMVWDSLVVGLLATMAGTALHHGWRVEEAELPPTLARSI